MLLSKARASVHRSIHWGCWRCWRHHLTGRTQTRLVHDSPLSDEGVLHQDRSWLCWRSLGSWRSWRWWKLMMRRWQTSSVVLKDCSETVHHVWRQRLLECRCWRGRHQDREDISIVTSGRRHSRGRGHLLQVGGVHLQVSEIIIGHSSHHSPLCSGLGHSVTQTVARLRLTAPAAHQPVLCCTVLYCAHSIQYTLSRPVLTQQPGL